MENGCLCVEPPTGARVRIPPEHVEEILVYGAWTLTNPVLALAVHHGIALSFYSYHGEWLGRLDAGEPTQREPHYSESQGFEILRSQWRMADDQDAALLFSKAFIQGKIRNSRALLAASRGRSKVAEDREQISCSATELRRFSQRLQQATTLEELRGVEGCAARSHFAGLSVAINSVARGEFPFSGRNRRPPKDCFNALLSYLYALLFNDCLKALRAEGLESRLGFLHLPHRGRHALALDLMEELRPLLADRMALALVNLQQLRQGHFFQDASTGGITLGHEGRRILFSARDARLRELILIPGQSTKIPWGQVPRHQARLLSEAIRKTNPALYVPFTPHF